jgi:hypothetical protein
MGAAAAAAAAAAAVHGCEREREEASRDRVWGRIE